MSATIESRPSEQPNAVDCPHCGTSMQADQEWCLECGAARTLIHAPPDWRIPSAIIGTIAGLALAGFAIALIGLSSTADRNAAVPVAGSVVKAHVLAASTTRPSQQFASWPIGLPGWTVVLTSKWHHAKAVAAASRIEATGLSVGILYSTDYPALNPGHWIVFYGRYPTSAQAEAQAASLIARGYTGAHIRQVAKPGA